jgi:hypothetical protein
MISLRISSYAVAAFLAAASFAFAQSSSSEMTPSEKAAQAKLEERGYTQVRDVKSSPEGISAKAVKDGRTIAVVIDSGGTIRERPSGQ